MHTGKAYWFQNLWKSLRSQVQTFGRNLIRTMATLPFEIWEDREGGSCEMSPVSRQHDEIRKSLNPTRFFFKRLERARTLKRLGPITN